MVSTFLLAAAVIVAVPLVVWWRVGESSFERLGPVLGAHYFAFLATSAVAYKILPFGWLKLVASTVAAAGIASLVQSRLPIVSEAIDTGRRTVIAVVGLALLSVSSDAFIFSRQGFSWEDRTSLFAAAFAGDIQRDTDVVGGLLRENQSVFFPRSRFTYQVLWHHAAANVVSVMPWNFTIFRYVLGATLATGFLFYVIVYWLAITLRPKLSASPLAAGVVVTLAATDADLYNALFSWLRDGRVGLAADASTRVESAFRYFSNKLITLSSPQHATFFILFGVVVAATYEPKLVAWGTRVWGWPRIWVVVGFTAASVAANPILAVLALPVYWAVLVGKSWLQGRGVRDVLLGVCPGNHV
jgi:hypothetical protein